LTFETLKRILKVRLSLNAYLILGIILLQSEELLCILELPSIAIVGAEDILYMPVVLKALNVRNIVVFIKLRTTDYWLGVARPIPSLALLERQLQLVYLVLTLSSIETTRVTTLLMTKGVSFGTVALISSGMLIRLLRYTLSISIIALSIALLGVVIKYVWYN